MMINILLFMSKLKTKSFIFLIYQNFFFYISIVFLIKIKKKSKKKEEKKEFLNKIKSKLR